ncbi:MAG: pyridoxal phosphate-dependent aminotransferase, partial [Myxococcota bacterium]|nr:pyridoxal phosphate-dependent aminotransferase [Myxococcota bacterium]
MPTFPGVSGTTDSLTSYVFTALRARIEAHDGPLHRLQIGDTWREPLPEARCEAQRTEDHPGLHRYAPVAG